jgi:hypothetical protein
MKLTLRSLFLVGALALAACGGDDEGSSSDAGNAGAEKGPIVIGAAIDQTKLMKFFDGPALAAAQIRAEEINAAEASTAARSSSASRTRDWIRSARVLPRSPWPMTEPRSCGSPAMWTGRHRPHRSGSPRAC